MGMQSKLSFDFEAAVGEVHPSKRKRSRKTKNRVRWRRINVGLRRPLRSFYLAVWLPPHIVDISSRSLSIAFVCSSTHRTRVG